MCRGLHRGSWTFGVYRRGLLPQIPISLFFYQNKQQQSFSLDSILAYRKTTFLRLPCSYVLPCD